MNLKSINYGINIIYKSNNINLNKIINELDSKFIKYEINNEIESFINVEVISHQNKIKFFVDDIEYKTITEVINKYNIVPKLFSKNLINDKYEIKLNKLEHEKDIELPELVYDSNLIDDDGLYPLIDCIFSTGKYKSKSEVRRLIQQGAVKLNGEKTGEFSFAPEEGMVIQVGKGNVFKLKEQEKNKTLTKTL